MRGLAAITCASIAVSCTPAATTRPPSEAVRVIPGALDAGKILAATAARARAQGAGELVPIGAAVVGEGERLGSFVDVPAEGCVLAIARAGASIRDLDLYAFDDGGDVLAADEAPDPAAAVLVCPPHPRRVYVAARIVSGTGIAALGVLPVPLAAADAVAREVGVRGRPGEDTGRLDAWAGLETKIRERRAQLGGSWEDLRRLAIPLDPRAASTLSVTVDAGRCLDVFVTPSAEIASLDMQVLDERGRIVGRGRGSGTDQGAVLCTGEARTLTVAVRPRLSHGTAAVIVGQSAPGAASELSEGVWIHGLAPLAPLQEAISAHRRRTAGLALEPPRKAGEAKARAGASGSVTVALEPGCSRIDVIGGTPLGPFTAELWSSDDRLVGTAAGGESAPLFACTTSAAQARVEVATPGVEGPFAVDVRRQPKPPGPLLDRPLAAALLLSRVEGASGPIDPSALATVEPVDIAPGARFRRAVDFDAGACREWIVAAEQPSGLVAELVDASGESLALARGERLLSIRRCAADELHAELRVRSGQGAGRLLLLSR